MVASQNSSASASLNTCQGVANSQLVRNSKLTITTTSTAANSLSAGQTQTVYKGNIVVAGTDSIQLAKLKFSSVANSAGFSFDTFKVYVNGSEYSVSAGNVVVSVDPFTVGTTATTFDVTFPSPVTLNGSATVEIKANVNGTVTSANTETINTRIMQ